MDDRPFHLVDVFAEGRYTGNQLAVIRPAGDLTTAEMQALAREMHFSETTFVESETPTDGGFEVRIFTPNAELEFAGHPTLGTAHVIREVVAPDRPDEVALNLGVGQIPVTVEGAGDDEVLWMTQRAPTFGETLDPAVAAEAVGLTPADVADDDPVQVVSTGLPTLVVPLASLDAVRRAETNLPVYRERVVEGLDVPNVLVFAPETVHAENDLHVRMFAPALGVPEDPATGSSNGCLAAFLARHRTLGGPVVDARVEQGYELERPSLLFLRAEDGDEVTVEVGGRVAWVADGTLR